MGCSVDAYFVGLRGHENPQDPIRANSRTGFVVTFANFLSIVGVEDTDIYCSLYLIF